MEDEKYPRFYKDIPTDAEYKILGIHTVSINGMRYRWDSDSASWIRNPTPQQRENLPLQGKNKT